MVFKHLQLRVQRNSTVHSSGFFYACPRISRKYIPIYVSRFLDEIKNAGTISAFPESRLVVMAFKYKTHDPLTGASAVQGSSQHLLLADYESHSDFKIILHNISQAYTQSELMIQRPIFNRVPRVHVMPPNILSRIQRFLYGLPESGLHFFVTCHIHHSTHLSISAAVHCPCLLFTPCCQMRGS